MSNKNYVLTESVSKKDKLSSLSDGILNMIIREIRNRRSLVRTSLLSKRMREITLNCAKANLIKIDKTSNEEVFLDSDMMDVIGYHMTVREFFIQLCGVNALYNTDSSYCYGLGYFVQNICVGDNKMKHSIHIRKRPEKQSYNNVIDECLVDYGCKYMLMCAYDKMYCVDLKQNNLLNILKYPEIFIKHASFLEGVIIFDRFDILKTFDHITYHPNQQDKHFNTFLELFKCQELPYPPAGYYHINRKFGPFKCVDPWKKYNFNNAKN